MIKDNNRICLAKSASSWATPAVCLTTGILAESNLQVKTTSGYNSTHQVSLFTFPTSPSPYARSQVHQIKLIPISGKFELAAAFFGTLFDVDHYACLLNDGCLSFATRREGVADNQTAPITSGTYLDLRHKHFWIVIIQNLVHNPMFVPPYLLL